MKKTKSTSELWDVIEEIALSLGVKSNTIAQWAVRGYVPPGMHHLIVHRAKKLKLSLTHEELHKQWKVSRLV